MVGRLLVLAAAAVAAAFDGQPAARAPPADAFKAHWPQGGEQLGGAPHAEPRANPHLEQTPTAEVYRGERIQQQGPRGAGTAAAPAPPSIPPNPPGTIHIDSHCKTVENHALDACTSDEKKFCRKDESPEATLQCLELNKDAVSRDCAEALHSLNECLWGPQLLVPMEIASFLLLATACVVLVCTLVRCCCRYICLPARLRHAELNEELNSARDDSSIASDDEPTVEPLQISSENMPPSKGTATSEKGADEDEDALPAYTEVVDNATLRGRIQ